MQHAFNLRIRIENAAFEGPASGEAVANILETVARELRGYNLHVGYARQLFDVNGNKVGRAETEE